MREAFRQSAQECVVPTAAMLVKTLGALVVGISVIGHGILPGVIDVPIALKGAAFGGLIMWSAGYIGINNVIQGDVYGRQLGPEQEGYCLRKDAKGHRETYTRALRKIDTFLGDLKP